MKIKLLNDGGYEDMDNVKFPVTVDAKKNKNHGNLYGVYGRDLISIGAKKFFDKNYLYHFELGSECEVIEE